MSSIKYSELLQDMMFKASKIGHKENPPFTAERFIAVLIDTIISRDNFGYNLELNIACEILELQVYDLLAAQKSLVQHIYNDNNEALLGAVYMKKRLKEAEELALSQNDKELDVGTLVTCILKNPSDAIKAVMDDRRARERKQQKMANAKSNVDKKDTEDDGSSEINDILNLLDDENDIGADQLLDSSGAMSKVEDEKNHDASAPEHNVSPQATAKESVALLVDDVKRIRTQLSERIFGQDNAINVFLTGYFQSCMLAMLDKSRTRPRATFLFAGPPGVGKTFLAEQAAQAIGSHFERFDMSEYCDKEAAIEFCGSDAVYKNGKEGNFTSVIRKNPRCIVLLDEIEKAHISIIHMFLQVLDAGRLRDNNTDQELSLKDVILIFTTNAGKQLYEDSDDIDLSTVSRKVIIDALKKDVKPETGVPYFPSAICSRFASGNVVMFNHVGSHDLRRIAKKEILKRVDNLEEEMNISMELEDFVYTALLFSEGTRADARTINSRANTFFNQELYELLRLISSDKGKTSIDALEKIKVCVDMGDLPESIKDLFVMDEKKQVLMLADKQAVALCEAKNPHCQIIGAETSKDAMEIIKSRDIALVILDVKFGLQDSEREKLNIEDVHTPARELMQILHEQKSIIPIYLLENGKSALNQEEKVSFTRQGVRGFLKISKANNDKFAAELNDILAIMHQQASMIKLARENKVITFETSQSISKNGKIATIRLFDFKETVAVDSEDAKDVLSSVSKPNVHFDEVIGADDAKKELKYFVEYLRHPKKYMGTGVKAPKGVILYGPPGTGKTMLAKAMACEAGVTFLAAEGNQFVKQLAGEGAQSVHDLFKTARKYAPSILFIDEIDAIAKERRGGPAATLNGEETLTAFLTEMDGFKNDTSRPVFVLAATNFDVEPGHDKSLDPALMRRFDRRVYIDLPNKENRIRFLNMKIAKNHALKISPKQVDNIAMRSTGMSLAELDSVVELALRSAIREGSTVVTDAILEDAFETFNGGEKKKWDASQLERVARHESGHALLCWLNGETPSYLTIVARGNHGGYMQHAEQEGKAIYTKEELLGRIRVSLGGRAAELAYYGERDGVSTGASGDLETATVIAQQIVCVYGMDDQFGPAVVHGQVASNGTMSVEVRAAVNRILREQMSLTVRLISENKDKIDALVEELTVKNHLNGEEINGILSSVSTK